MIVEDADLRRCRFSGALRAGYRVRLLRDSIIRAVHRVEGDRFRSGTLRDILAMYHGVEVGAYSYGCCLRPGVFPRGVSIGRYVSIAKDVGVYRRRRRLDRLSLHPFFFNSSLGAVSGEEITDAPLRIEHDAWIGDRAVVLPGCRRIGVGAVVGAGAVVTRDVPDFAIVVGNPAAVIRFRFDQDVQAAVLASRWWECSIEELIADRARFVVPVDALPAFVRDPDGGLG